MSHDASTRAEATAQAQGLAVGALALAAVFVVVYRQVLDHTADELAAAARRRDVDGAQAATEAFVARDGMRPHDASLLCLVDRFDDRALVEGVNFFPGEDVEGARSSVHILMFGWREGEIGMQMAALLERKLGEGVEVRVIVDSFGSRPYKEARDMFTRLSAAGAQIVVNDLFPLDRDGLFPDDQRLDWRQDEVGRPTTASSTSSTARLVDRRRRHRGPLPERRLPDVMVRVTGDVVRQLSRVPHQLSAAMAAACPPISRRTSPSPPIPARHRSPWRR